MRSRTEGGHEALLQANWRKVASTHELQDLVHAGDDGATETSRRRPLFCRRLAGGTLLVACTAVGTAATAVLALHLIPASESLHPAARHIREAWYYFCLVPLTLPVAVFAVGVNWFSLKVFKHNSVTEAACKHN